LSIAADGCDDAHVTQWNLLLNFYCRRARMSHATCICTCTCVEDQMSKAYVTLPLVTSCIGTVTSDATAVGCASHLGWQSDLLPALEEIHEHRLMEVRHVLETSLEAILRQRIH